MNHLKNQTVMKKFVLLTIIASILSLDASSQLRFGLRGGLNTAYFDADVVHVPEQFRITTLSDASFGFHFGVMAQASFFGLFIQPELLLSSINNDVRVEDLRQNGIITTIREQSFTKLDFPVLAGVRFGPARIGLGPVGTFMLATSSELGDDMPIREEFNSATFGYQVGAGLDIFSRFAVDIKYEGNLTRLGSGITVAGQHREFDTRTRQIIFSLGVYL
jgi:hypothetical protein